MLYIHFSILYDGGIVLWKKILKVMKGYIQLTLLEEFEVIEVIDT